MASHACIALGEEGGAQKMKLSEEMRSYLPVKMVGEEILSEPPPPQLLEEWAKRVEELEVTIRELLVKR